MTPIDRKRMLHEDADLLVVDKPAGLATVPGGWGQDEPSLLKTLEADCGRLWIVHRLDKVTSGVIVFARTAEAHRALSTQFERREARKVYHALCAGAPPWEQRTARHPLRIDVGHSHRSVVDHGKGKPSETAFRLLERFSTPEGDFSLLEALPGSGRTHQVRVHAYALGFPLLGDALYGAPQTGRIARPALHARSLELTHPASGERLTFSAPHPLDFEKALEKLRAGR